MATSTTTFEERVARIHQRAAKGANTGFVEPGVVDETVSPRSVENAMRTGKKRGGYLASVVGGLVTSVAIVGIGAAVLMGGAGENTFEDFAASILLPSQ